MTSRTARWLLLGAASAVLLSPWQPTRAQDTKAAKWSLLAWNDLGMHCMDSDYTVFSVLPPFNNVYAQLVAPNGQLVDVPTGFTLTYEAVADPSGSINKSSIGKTDFWNSVNALFGAALPPDAGLAGNAMPGPSNTPQPMSFDASLNAWIGAGIPITPFDDAGHHRTYPLMKIVARDASGAQLATATPVLPVSDEMDCRACHASGSGQLAAKPAAGWSFDPSSERDYRLNILRLHDESQSGDPAYAQALAHFGYAPAGLYDTVVQLGRPILCASCHASNALPGTGLAGISALTSAEHAGHADVIDPENGLTLGASENRAACYRCHPGSETKCLRGAMGSAVAADGELAMQCQDCHGSMSKVGDPLRVGWLEQPNCQACHTGTATHNNGQIVYTNAYEPSGALRVAVDATYATNPNVPMAPFSLYRFSKGHGGLMCEACHGSTHAEFPALHVNDNLQAQLVQGHKGMLVECTACHGTVPTTVNGGPHGMHSVTSEWLSWHGDIVEQGGAAQCQACHGSNYRGTVLSLAQNNRSFTTSKYGTKTFFDGQRIGCYDCHNGPSSDNPTTNQAPVAQNGSLTAGNQPVPLTLLASDPTGQPITLRIVEQPAFGRVGLSGMVATYIPDPGFAGIESFTFAANDGSRDSNLGRVTVTRLANQGNYGYGYAGTYGVPAFQALGQPVLGTTLPIQMGNSSGLSSTAFVLVANELANKPSGLGGALACELQSLIVLPLPAAGANLMFAIPNSSSLVGATYYGQSVQIDLGATFDLAFSRGLRLTLGP